VSLQLLAAADKTNTGLCKRRLFLSFTAHSSGNFKRRSVGEKLIGYWNGRLVGAFEVVAGERLHLIGWRGVTL